jgi:hypothetical protein
MFSNRWDTPIRPQPTRIQSGSVIRVMAKSPEQLALGKVTLACDIIRSNGTFLKIPPMDWTASARLPGWTLNFVIWVIPLH